MSEIFYHLAASLDGFIAHADGSFDGFIWDDEVISDFVSDQSTFGTVLMGRKTYDVGVKEGKTSPYPSMRQIVFSRSMRTSLDPAVELINDDLVGFVRNLKSESEHPIWLCGGAEIATPLFKAGLIEKVVVKLNPVMFGTGIPLLREVGEHVSLRLDETKQYSCGIMLLKYSVDIKPV